MGSLTTKDLPDLRSSAHAAGVDEVMIQQGNTLHGQLQRGLGRGARRAAQVRGSGELVYDCVRQDPRWDRQVESRGLYYARLIVDLELSCGPLAEHLFDPDDLIDSDEWRTSLTIDVLAHLVRLTRPEAAQPLPPYAMDRANWCEALDAPAPIGDVPLTAGPHQV